MCILYVFSYQSADGSQRQETGTLKYPAVPGYPPILSVQGAYAAITPEGESRWFYTTSITAFNSILFFATNAIPSHFFIPIRIFLVWPILPSYKAWRKSEIRVKRYLLGKRVFIYCYIVLLIYGLKLNVKKLFQQKARGTRIHGFLWLLLTSSVVSLCTYEHGTIKYIYILYNWYKIRINTIENHNVQ